MKNDFNRGISILGIIFWGFILILILSYFNISIKGVVESPTGRENLGYVEGKSKSIWFKYLEKPANYIWNDIFINLFWKSFVSNLERIRDGKSTDFDNAAPQVDYNNTKGS
ncbi:hypothetical protein A3D42_01205 [Candidatus Nomurabacteria bacterium RIFCSPHIGHO2_02_FULL_41_18]|uniref:Uncharacterized protein n=1 Tax=Candidatus Nomurabacteria bacterium RIFCSPHIGHO2_02_FULL_41_18 TaxID=1801754 RepID=A0A1F6W6P1_9BACT|nr:MAG: hypothetical protein A2737_03410 [Candidatus Nomurabacteria bacterium RIFCSPHIGHO2_01_FULL_41_71]OGI77597.1 MAG: hypothetical protein A3D42_01205 [Candidatus Nomurabacteria bacterium RIFCSPHIGHO2_02_FULL_41_18]OGI89097.1 MAG: hypothetical protein A3B01_00785 [Candidatus Nomurabacteria bacterium RIFCSPLOWO2_01_FULL_41_52b]OGJ00391.1 MAG: hypothetical protein A3I90_00640 [Candidatus Nomurabacteria bacterium RIFCSPLOWO2_02_FULL_41_9]